jgi:MFS superfamily sulfate permease-like transporter
MAWRASCSRLDSFLSFRLSMNRTALVNETSMRHPWLSDALASVVAFVVALPLCIGIAVACGVPAERGLATGIIGGVVVGLLAHALDATRVGSKGGTHA